MKQLTCEMCGSTDLIKQDGVFVCQTCGCKYSIEEAKKMMVEGTVEVTGTVKVDNSEKVNNMLLNALRAYNDKKFSQSQELCASILIEEPNNAVAILYEGLSIGWQGNTVRNTIDKAGNAAIRAIKLASMNMEPIKVETFILDVVNKMLSLFIAYENLETEALQREQNNLSMKRRMLEIRIKTAGSYADFDELKRQNNEIYAEGIAITEKYRRMTEYDLSIVFGVYKSMADIISNIDNFSQEILGALINTISSLKNHVTTDADMEKASSIIKILENYKENKIRIYWELHRDEKDALLQEEAALMREKDELESKIKSGNDQIANLNDVRLPAEEERDSLREESKQLSIKRDKLGIFKLKEKKECEARIDEIQKKLLQLEAEINNQRTELKQANDMKVNDVNMQLQSIKNRLSNIEKRLQEINKELTKER